MMKEIGCDGLKKEVMRQIVAFSIAECGAEGNPGNVIFLTDGGEFYVMNQMYSGCAKEVYSSFSLYRNSMEFLRTKSKIPKGWNYTDLGSGNHLFMIQWLDTLFYKEVNRNCTGSEKYAIWIEVASQIINRLANKESFQKERSEQRTNFLIVPYAAERKSAGPGAYIREHLSVEWDSGSNRQERVLAIGINPSTAQNGETDLTMTKLCRFLDMYGFNNVSMLNLFESVSPVQNMINESSVTDFRQKKELLDGADLILLVWGVGGHKAEKEKAMGTLVEYADKLYCIVNTNGRYPAHPSRMSYQSKIKAVATAEDFGICGLNA